MTPTAPIPDALLIPDSWKQGSTLAKRVTFVSMIAEPLLGVDREAGQRAYIFSPAGQLFITRDRLASMDHPTNSPRRGQPRYCWLDGTDGVRRGWLTPEALAELAELLPPPPPPWEK